MEIDAVTGVLVIRPETDALIDLDALQRRVRESGFTPRDIDIAVTGRVERWNDRMTVVVGSQRFLLAPTERIAEIERVAEANQGSATVTGRASRVEADGHGEHPYTIDIQTVSAPR